VSIENLFLYNFSHSFKLKQSLSEAQKELDLPCHHLVTGCQTKWSSIHKMASRVLEKQKVVLMMIVNTVILYQHGKMYIDDLESLEAALGLLADFIDMLSAENFVAVYLNL